MSAELARGARRSLRLIRTSYRRRGTSRGSGETAYLVYLVVFASITAFFPVARLVVLEMASPAVRAVLAEGVASGALLRSVALGCALFGAAFVALSTVRGPIAASPFMISLLIDGPFPRRRSLLRPFAVALGFVALGFAAAGAVIGAGLGGGSALWFGTAAGAFAGALLAWCWLAGLYLRGRAWVLALALVLWGVLGMLVPEASPWGAVGFAMLGSGGALLVVAAISLLLALSVPPMLDRLSSEELRTQAFTWQTAGDAAGLGDFATAIGSLQARATHFRGVHAVRDLRLGTLFFVRDLIAALRTPMRFGFSVSAMGVLPFAAVWVLGVQAAAPALVGAALTIAAYLALGGLTDGYAHAAGTAGAPSIYGWSTRKLFLLHSILPLVLGIAGAVLGWVAATPMVVDRAPFSLLGPLLLSVPLMLAMCVAARAYDSVKGPLPVVLTTPISSPAGDPGLLLQLAWRADALIYVAVLGAAAIYLELRAPLAGAAIAVLGLAFFAFGALRRMRQL